MPSFVGYGFEPAQGSPLDPSPVIAALEGSGRSWATKDPRLSLTASEWLPHLTTDRTRPPPVRPLVESRPSRLPVGGKGPGRPYTHPGGKPPHPHKMRKSSPTDHQNRCACSRSVTLSASRTR